jgi:hypothetical protein
MEGWLNLRTSPPFISVPVNAIKQKERLEEERKGQNGLEIEIWKSDFLSEVSEGYLFIGISQTPYLCIYLGKWLGSAECLDQAWGK